MKKVAVVSLGCLLVLVLAQRLSPQPAPLTRYVNNSDPTCQGQAPCYPTLQAGVTALQAGETLLIQAGTYDETVTIANKNNVVGASEADRMFILADPSAPVGSVVLGSRRAGKCIGGTNVVHIQDSQFLTLRGLTIRDASQWALDLAGGKNIRSRAIHLERNRIFNDAALKCRGGIQIGAENTETVLSNNLIYGNREEGIVFKQGI